MSHRAMNSTAPTQTVPVLSQQRPRSLSDIEKSEMNMSHNATAISLTRSSYYWDHSDCSQSASKTPKRPFSTSDLRDQHITRFHPYIAANLNLTLTYCSYANYACSGSATPNKPCPTSTKLLGYIAPKHKRPVSKRSVVKPPKHNVSLVDDDHTNPVASGSKARRRSRR
jgi:hypothetical protein